jgi:hypothetical protein
VLYLHLQHERYLTAQWAPMPDGGRVLRLAVERCFSSPHGRYRLRSCGPITIGAADGEALLTALRALPGAVIA